jgi:tRNA pseudouridine55 synthase
MHGAFLIDKPVGLSSFGVIEKLQRAWCERSGIKRRDLPKIGHGGTLDPFATGLLVVCVGEGVKLARYFLGSTKVYEGLIRFGEATVPGDPTAEISERSEHLPSSLEEVREAARQFTLQPYLQTPPMHSAKKLNGRPLYELARQGIEVEREAKSCILSSFRIDDLVRSDDGRLARSHFELVCSSGTYVRVLSQDLARKLGTVGMLDSLRRKASGIFDLSQAMTLDDLIAAPDWEKLPCFAPFHRLLDGYPRALATPAEAVALRQGKQATLFGILKRVQAAPPVSGAELNEEYNTHIAIYEADSLVAVAVKDESGWGLERVFMPLEVISSGN